MVLVVGGGGTVEEGVSRTPTCWDSDVVLLLGCVSVGDVGALPLESEMSSVRRSRVDLSHFVTRNLRRKKTKAGGGRRRGGLRSDQKDAFITRGNGRSQLHI